MCDVCVQSMHQRRSLENNANPCVAMTVDPSLVTLGQPMSWFSLNWKTRPFELASKAKDTWRTQVIVQVVNTQSTGSSSLFLIVGVGLGACNSGTGRCKRWHRSRAAS